MQAAKVDCREYKSGAKYKGEVDNFWKAGWGSFVWPNGSTYEGHFVDNVRHGNGEQRTPKKLLVTLCKNVLLIIIFLRVIL